MDFISQWGESNLDIVFFIYGLAFMIMGVSILVQLKKMSELKLANILWLLAVFALIHAAREWLDMWEIIRGKNNALSVAAWLALFVSYVFLFEFGRQLLRLNLEKFSSLLKKLAGLLYWWVTPLFMFLVFILSINCADFWKTSAILTRYILGFPGGLLIGFGFIVYYRYEKERLGLGSLKKYSFLAASFSFFAYGIFGGLVVPQSNFFPANYLNHDSFLSLVHIPVQVFRALCALIAAYAIGGVLSFFNWEMIEKIKRALSEEEKAKEELEWTYQAQVALTKIRLVSLEKISLEEMLDRVIDYIVSPPWLSLQQKGAIFLVEDDPSVLVLKSQRGLALPLLSACARVPFGRCLCGRAALSGKIEFTGYLDERHENTYEGITPHGHYCVPITSEGKVLGVITLYVKEGHPRRKEEEEFLAQAANILVSVVRHKRAEGELEKRIKDLETFNRIAVDRELRMVELKKKIEELEKKLSEKG